MSEQASFQERLFPPAPTILPPTAFSVDASTPSLPAASASTLSRASTPARRCDSQTLPIVVLFFSAQRYFMKGIVMTGMAGR